MTPQVSATALLCCLLAALPAGCKQAEKKKIAEEEAKPKAAAAGEGGGAHEDGRVGSGTAGGVTALIQMNADDEMAKASSRANGKAIAGQPKNTSTRLNMDTDAAPVAAPSLTTANASLAGREGRVAAGAMASLPPAAEPNAAATDMKASALPAPAKIEVERSPRLDAPGRREFLEAATQPRRAATGERPGSAASTDNREVHQSRRAGIGTRPPKLTVLDATASTVRDPIDSAPLLLGAAAPAPNDEAARAVTLSASSSSRASNKTAAVPIRLGSLGAEGSGQQPSRFPTRADVLAGLAASSSQHVALWSPVHPRGKAFTREEAIRLIENSADPRVLAIVLPEDDAAGWQALIDRTTAELHVTQWLADAGDDEAARRERAARRAADQQADLVGREKLRDSFYRMLLGREGGGEK